jgi:hypothetical protein
MLTAQSHDEMRRKTLLLREVVELLMWELSALTNRKWEHLPELKKRKSLLAVHLLKYDWTPAPEGQEPLDLVMLRSQIADLEYQSRQKVQVQLQMIKGQIDYLQGQKQTWLECLNIYSQQFSKPVPTL